MARDTHFEVEQRMTPMAFEKITTLHELLKVAINDFKIAQTMPNIVIDMRRWYVLHTINERCSVCMAGAVLANTYQRPRYSYSPSSDPSAASAAKDNRLKAINFMRIGNIRCAAHELRIPITKTIRQIEEKYVGALYGLHNSEYPCGYEHFLSLMDKLQKDLEILNI